MSDYESDSSAVLPKPVPVPCKLKKQPAKRKAPTDGVASAAIKTSKKSRGTDLFQLEGDTSNEVRAHSKTELGSSVINKVANGRVRRTAELNGDFYVDLKVYHKAEIASVSAEERWKKAALSLKVQLDQESLQWHQLQKFVKGTHELFQNSDAVFYSDKVNFK